MRISDWSSDVCSSDLAGASMGSTGAGICGLNVSLVAAVAAATIAERCRVTGFERDSWTISTPNGTLRTAQKQKSTSQDNADQDRKSVVYEKSVTVRVSSGGPPRLQKKNITNKT